MIKELNKNKEGREKPQGPRRQQKKLPQRLRQLEEKLTQLKEMEMEMVMKLHLFLPVTSSSSSSDEEEGKSTAQEEVEKRKEELKERSDENVAEELQRRQMKARTSSCWNCRKLQRKEGEML